MKLIANQTQQSHNFIKIYGIARRSYGQIRCLKFLSSLLMLGLSLIGALIIVGISTWLIEKVFIIPVDLHQDALQSMTLLAIAIPFVALMGGARGFLEAFHHFKILNILQVFLGVYTFLSPLLACQYEVSLRAIVLVLILGRILFFSFHLYFCHHYYPALGVPKFSQKVLPRVMRFGLWMTVSNIIGPMMVYFDRFVLGSLIPIQAVSYYTTPFEGISRLLVVPTALVRVLFPVFSSTQASKNSEVQKAFSFGIGFVAMAMFVPCFVVFLFAYQGMALWLGEEFAKQSYVALQILAIGVYLNALALIPFTLLQSLERVDLTSKIHLVELPFYIIVLWVLIKYLGVTGAAVAWTLRVLADALLMFYFAKKSQVQELINTKSLYIYFIGPIVLFTLGFFVVWLWVKFLLAVMCIGYVIYKLRQGWGMLK